LLVADPLFKSRIGAVEVVEQFADVRARSADRLLFVGQFSEWGGNEDGWHVVMGLEMFGVG
jgi:hypothetical protein